MKDRELTRLLQAHPEEGLEAAMLEYAPLVKGILCRILPQNPCDREECMADVFVALWRSAAKLEAARTPLRPWLAVAARNRGIELAQGDYLLFVDGDDWLAPNLLEDLSASVAATPADLYLFGALVERDGKVTGELHEELPADLPTHTKDAPQLFFGVMAPWNRAYRRTLFTEGGIRFATKVWYEDIRIVTKVLALAEQVVRLPGAYYHYLQREGSAMNNKNCARNVEILYAFDDILGWFGEHGLREAYRDELTFLAISHLLIAASVRVARIDCKSELLGQFRDYMEKNFPDFRENRYLPRLDRNKRLVYRLLLKRRYRAVRLLFRVKDALGR